MKSKRYQLFSAFLIVLCLNSLFYNQIMDTNLKNDKNDSKISAEFPESNDKSKEKSENDHPVQKSETLGDFKTFAFFPSGTGYIYGTSRIGESLITDPSGEDPYSRRNVVEWVPYNDIKDDGTLNKEFYWRALSSVPLTWANNTDWFYLREQGYPNEPSKIYSPVFTEDYEISGKVHWWSYLEVNNSAVFSEAVTIGYRVLLYLFNPSDPLNPQLIATRTQTYPISMWNGYRTFSDDIVTTTIPAGYRLRWDIQLRFSSVPTTGSFLQYTGYPWGGVPSSTTWTINDGIYSNTYTINNATRMTGIQLYMRSKKTPDINVFGATNDTVYQSAPEMTIDVTDGSISRYRWDTGGWNSFDNQTTTILPSTHGWHDLEVEATDPVFGNTRVEYYRFGYDASTTNLVLNTPADGSTVEGGAILDFSAYNVDTVEYMWDNNGTWYPLSSPYDVTSPGFIGLHNITLKTTDFYTTENFFYQFIFDSEYPTVILYNVINDSTYAPSKVIEVDIYDDFGIQNVYYHWDSGGDVSWSPAQGNIYQTNLPASDGYHYLYVSAYDNYNHLTSLMYRFYTDSNVFLVELAELRNNSYYYGGDDVILNVQRSNGTIRYSWDNGTVKDGSIISGQLTLTGTDALPLTEGFHNLTIYTFDITDTAQKIFFNFTVDRTAPIIDNSILTYDNTRCKPTDDPLNFTITDNFNTFGDLIVLISIDEKANQTLNYPYQLLLLPFTNGEGEHEFYLYVFDLAGNFDVVYITFFIDTIAPTIEINIPDEVDFTLKDGNIYVPFNATVEVTLTDEDPIYYSYYSWNGSPLTMFTGDLYLNYPDGSGWLYIYVNDTLGNPDFYNETLIIDTVAPNILSIYAESTIVNGYTDFDFNVEEDYPATVEYVKYYWDALKYWWKDALTTDFTLNMLPNAHEFYDHNSTATVVIETSDVLGNVGNYSFSFITDFEAPILQLYLNESGVLTELIDGDTKYVTGNTPIWYNSSSNLDLKEFWFTWDGVGRTRLFASGNWTFPVIAVDGNHTLQIELIDNTISEQANILIATFNIIVSDIYFEYVEPNDIEWINDVSSFRVNYSDVIYFTVNVTDTVFNMEIADLSTRSHQELYYFNIDIIKVDSTVYNCTIVCSNVTNGLETYVDFEFYTLAGGSRTIRVNLIVDKKEGELSVLDESRLTVYYNDNVTVYLNFKDHIGSDWNIILLEVNSISTPFFQVDSSTFGFNFSTYGYIKGNYSLDIYVESKYNYDNTDDSFILEFEVLPLLMILDIQVSNFTVLEGTQLAITGILYYENGTGVGLEELHFYIYSYSYDQTTDAQASIPTNYTSFVILNRTTDFSGEATVLFSMSPDIDYVMIYATYDGDNFRAASSLELEDKVIRIVPPGLPSWMLYLIIGGSVLVVVLIAFIVYKVTRPKEFEELISKLADEDIAMNFSIMSPGTVLTIFDQRKGPTPLLEDHSLEIARYKNRMQIDVENFLLKIADQAYSSLGFEEHDPGRRTGSIVLPREKM
ncbi:MAG: hypothetical protein H7641_05490, partial [Candidatus Heimdallarchaeota archaeon]|nr:hypothetical protein [Candidatus Heimdallarchaeota archaeon]MCK4877015.1 hypothetical protein [Candidatus Heimdallarchaeota archaeon]